MPIEPDLTRWRFPHPDQAGTEGVVGVGADLEPGTVLAAYRRGMFPMPIDGVGPMGWWSPHPRGVLPLSNLRVSRSLRKSIRRFTTTIDTAFGPVIEACADPRREHGWITPEIIAAYRHLHTLGWAHSIETWSREGELVGGLYGIAVGGLFAGESMFHRARDASKVALVRLVAELVQAGGERLLDVQWATEHLTSLGAVEISRQEYLQRLHLALELPLPAPFDDQTGGRDDVANPRG